MRAKKVDNCQRVIVQALKQVGALVEDTSGVGEGFPDLIVGYRGKLYLLECKEPKTGVLTDSQIKWHATWRGYVQVVHDPYEALKAIQLVT